MSDKQEATFRNVIGFADYAERGVTALLGGVKGHPRLGQQDSVRTSRIERIEYSGDQINAIETLNTLYVREGY